MLDTIEKYVVEFDMWMLLKIKMHDPLREIVAFPIGGARILIFG